MGKFPLEPRAEPLEPNAKCQNRFPELGQTAPSPFLHNSLSINRINQIMPNRLPVIGQTAVWPNNS
jgi:hypothetical protein